MADPDLSFHFNADPVPAPRHNDMNLRSLVYRLSNLSLQATIMNPHGTLQLYFEPLNLFGFDLNADADLSFHFNGDLDPASQSYVDPCKFGSESATLQKTYTVPLTSK